MSYFPSQDNPNIPSGIVFFGNPAVDQKFEASSNLVYDSGNDRLSVGNVSVNDSAYIGSESYPNLLQLNANGTAEFASGVVVQGDLVVQGNTVSVNVETVTIDDNIIVLNNNNTTGLDQDAGIEVERGSGVDNVRILWDEGIDKWTFTNDGTTYYEIGGVISITAGSGIVNNGTETNPVLDIKVDNSTIEIVDDTVRVKNQGIVTDKIADGAVIESKITRTVSSSFANNQVITNDINLVTGGSGGITIKLPAPASGKMVMVKKVDSGSGPVTIARNDVADTIDGATSKALYYQYESMTFVSDGINWFIV